MRGSVNVDHRGEAAKANKNLGAPDPRLILFMALSTSTKKQDISVVDRVFEARGAASASPWVPRWHAAQNLRKPYVPVHLQSD
jgi:hypothetical protein